MGPFVGRAHASYQPVARGQLPFYVSSTRAGGEELTVHDATWFRGDEVATMAELITSTTDWFVQALARYLDEHGV